MEEIRNDLSHLAKTYHSSYKASHSTLKKHRILQRLRGNKDIVIIIPGKGNGVVVLNRSDYDRLMLDIISDQSKFVKTNEWKISKGQTPALFEEVEE